MTSELTVAAVVALRVRRELEDDYVGLWVVPWHIRRTLRDGAVEQVQAIARAVLEALLATDVAIGSLDETSGSFTPWPSDSALDSAMRSWRDLGRDPNIGEVAWLASTV